jgi:hypothetical protein
VNVRYEVLESQLRYKKIPNESKRDTNPQKEEKTRSKSWYYTRVDTGAEEGRDT